MLSDEILLIAALFALALVALLPLIAPHWRLLLLGFLVYLAFEGLARRLFPTYQQWVYVAKDAILLPIYIGCYLEYLRRKKVQVSKVHLNFSLVMFFLFTAVIFVQALNPNNRGFLLAFISLKVYLWYLPLILVAYAWAWWDTEVLQSFRRVYWIIIPVLLMAVFQAITGWGTAYYIQDSIVAAGGTHTRAIQSGTLVNISSTLFGGRLATFSAVWALIFFTLVLHYIESREKKRLFGALFLMAFISLIFGFNNTALVSTVFGLVVLTLFALSISSLNINRRSLALTLGIGVAILFIFVTIQLSFRGQNFIITTDHINTFFGRIFISQQREVVTTNIWLGLQATYKSVGFWGWGTGSLTQGTDYVVPSLAGGYSFMYETRSESILLRTMIELGVLGTLVFVIAYLSLMWNLLRYALLWRVKKPQVAIFVMGSAVVLFLYLMMAYKHHGFAGDPTLQTYVYVWVGLGLGMIARTKDLSTAYETSYDVKLIQQRYKRNDLVKSGVGR